MSKYIVMNDKIEIKKLKTAAITYEAYCFIINTETKSSQMVTVVKATRDQAYKALIIKIVTKL